MRALSGKSGMWVAGAVLALVFVGSTLPTSLYDFYQSELHFSEITLTLIYSAYVAGTLLTLLFVGRISDQIGRRPAALAGLALAAASMLVFVAKIAIAVLFVARFLTGLAVGLAAGAATAWIAELDPRKNVEHSTSVAVGSNLFGLALGPLLALIALVALLPMAFAVAKVRETVKQSDHRASEISLRPRIGVPQESRARFFAPALTGFGIFALGGFYAALTPGLLRGPLSQTNRAVVGLVIFEFFTAGAAAIALTPRMRSKASMLAGLALLVPSLALVVMSGMVRSLPLVVVATALGGVALAFGYRGSLEVVNQIAPDDRRAEIVSTYLLFCYTGTSLPVIGVGIVSQLVSPPIAHIAFAITIALFALGALLASRAIKPVATAG